MLNSVRVKLGRVDFLTPTLPFIRALHSIHWLQAPMQAVSLLGTEEFFLFLVPLLYWCFDRKLGARLGLLLLFSVLLNDYFKLILVSPRPFWFDAALSTSTEKTFGFPSGHAQNAAALWPFLALQSEKRRLWLPLAIAFAFLIAFSRLVVGAHFPADVVGGLILGTLMLLAYLHYEQPVRDFLAVRPISWSVALPFAFVLAMEVATQFLIRGHLPAAGRALLALNEGNKGVASSGGAFFGLACGLVVARSWSLAQRVPLPMQLGRFLIGAIGIALFWRGLAIIVPDDVPFHFVRYFATTFWVSCGALWVFKKIGLDGRLGVAR